MTEGYTVNICYAKGKEKSDPFPLRLERRGLWDVVDTYPKRVRGKDGVKLIFEPQKWHSKQPKRRWPPSTVTRFCHSVKIVEKVLGFLQLCLKVSSLPKFLNVVLAKLSSQVAQHTFKHATNTTSSSLHVTRSPLDHRRKEGYFTRAIFLLSQTSKFLEHRKGNLLM